MCYFAFGYSPTFVASGLLHIYYMELGMKIFRIKKNTQKKNLL